jgi:hypothetical protein
VGCLIVGLVARYGSDKIRGHGIPEAMEAILVGDCAGHHRRPFVRIADADGLHQ